MNKFLNSKYSALVVLGAVGLSWLVIFLSMPWSAQNFPQNDDWAFAKGLYAFMDTGKINYYHWPAFPLLGQWLWAMPFVTVLGQTFMTLRIATITLSFCGFLAFYKWLCLPKSGHPLAPLFALAILAFNPYIFIMSGSFMSDVNALSFSIIAISFYAYGFQKQNWWLIGAGALFAILAGSTRQNAIASAVGVAMIAVLDRNWRRNFIAMAAVFIPIVTTVAIHFWHHAREDVTHVFLYKDQSLFRIFTIVFCLIHICGIVISPLLFLRQQAWSKRWFLGYLVFFVAGSIWVYFNFDRQQNNLFPYFGNVINPYGVGFSNYGHAPIIMGSGFRMLLTLVGDIGAAWIMMRMMEMIQTKTWATVMSIFVAVHLALLIYIEFMYDRYYIVFFPAAISLVSSKISPQAKLRWGIPALLFFLVSSVFLMHDWMSWNSALWKLGHRAIEQNVATSYNIEGGFEWDGWYSREESNLIRSPTPEDKLKLMMGFTHVMVFPQNTGEFALSFVQLGNTTVVDREPFYLWLNPESQEILLIKWIEKN